MPPRGIDDIGGLTGYGMLVGAAMQRPLRVRLEGMMKAGQSDSLWDVAVNLGIEKGIEKGIEQGRAEGALETSRRLLFELFKSRGWRVPAVQKRRVEGCRDPEVLAGWVTRAFTAQTLAEALVG
jgi:hypothetical protein